ncbi:MAG: DNA mismatch repair protein MutS [Chthonomonas sp.]|nr:DNA mismatch repair protein MutS [Chthonomonas sp.]
MKPRTPMLQQYFQAKEAHPGVLMAMRVGDFYEFYGDDATLAAEILQITLTGRDDGPNGRIAMAGVPFHSVEKYLARLVASGQKVALCDQVEDPKTAKGLVRRAVTRVLSAGTVLEDSMLAPNSNNFLSALCLVGDRAGFAALDPSTGEFMVTEIAGEELQMIALQELSRIRPSELLCSDTFSDLPLGELGIAKTEWNQLDARKALRSLQDHFRVNSLDGFGLGDNPSAWVAAAMVLTYASKNGLELGHVETISSYSIESFMGLDPSTRRALELTENLSDRSKRFTLLSVLDQTVTSPGARLLKRWIEQPLLDAKSISARHDAVERFVKVGLHRADLRDALARFSDLERLVGRCSAGLAGPRDLAAMRTTLVALPNLEAPLSKVNEGRIAELYNMIGDHSELASLLDEAVMNDPPHSMREGGIIKPGYDAELDKLRDISRDGRKFIAELEQAERERTGIATLKVGFNNVFGYYLEVSKLHQSKVPQDFIRKQTTANAERYITAQLKDHENAVLGASDKAQALEGELFIRLRTRISEHSATLLQTARALAELDVLSCLAEVAVSRDYRRPEIVEDDILEIETGRHPVVEANAPNFVPNDSSFDGDERLMVLTGPNMSGKSTYLRQVATIVLLAQIGSFVPARKAKLGLCDRIFARIGAKDEIALGQSTFMVEMTESAFILNHATESSLVVLDEVGRGTSTFDGLAIAWAMLERLSEIGSKTMFATHYHQLNVLADQLPGVANYRVSVKEVGDDIVWTHKVLPGGTDRSYGIHVARKAGVPRPVLERASEILEGLELAEPAAAPKPSVKGLQLTLFEVEDPPVVKKLKQLDVEDLTPLQAIALLGEWKKELEVPKP